MSIDITFFNVGHGDSILIEKRDDDRIKTIVVDCNLDYKDKRKVPVYEYLKANNIRIIDGIIITHMHADHISGIHKILQDRAFTIKKLVIPPIFSMRVDCYNQFFKSWHDALINDAKRINPTSDDELSAEIGSRGALLDFIKKNRDIVAESIGPESLLRFKDVDVDFWVYLPLPGTKPMIEKVLTERNYSPTMCKALNDFSLAVELKYGENAILLTGDSTAKEWREHKKKMNRDGITTLGNNMLKSPHHGSKIDNDLLLYNYYMNDSADEEHYVFISASGFNKKPHSQVLTFISNNGMKVRCTNISKSCSGDGYNNKEVFDTLPPHIRSFIASYDVEKTPTPCMGNIFVTMDKTLPPVITSSTGHTCFYDLPAVLGIKAVEEDVNIVNTDVVN